MSTAKRRRLPASARREVIELAATRVFAEHGYRGASIDEIAARAEISAPVLYDHFASKLELYRRLLERTRNELLEMWREHLFSDEPAEVRIPRALDAWARYVENHREATRMFFREATGDPEAEAVQREIQAQGRVAISMLLAREPGVENLAGSAGQEILEMAAEILRAGLTGLAIWWHEHPHVPREQVVTTAVNVLWTGFDRARRGEG
ncbi:MAG: TetR/AcrR family transcriptional regulator [Actinomycetota bacterium]|nr:TetR/AcrR family transcriptional regulator [Actinomycetota bacterium]